MFMLYLCQMKRLKRQILGDMFSEKDAKQIKM